VLVTVFCEVHDVPADYGFWLGMLQSVTDEMDKQSRMGRVAAGTNL
jgi:hypothetical protein